MKNKLLVFLISIFAYHCNAQIYFEKGYFINNSGQRTDCLIKNIDWKNNPTKFQYKLSEKGEIKIATIKSIEEFGITGLSKYNKYIVNIDRSSKNIKNLSTVKKSMFNEEQLFLKVLVEGKANLYVYEDKNLRRYFYKTDISNIEQLVFKNYRTTDNKVGENKRYKQQLWNNLKCQNIQMKSIENINYKKNELVNLFIKYNECHNSEFTHFEKKQKGSMFNLTLRPGLNSSSLLIQRNTSVSSREADFDGELGFRIGIEAELILPFNKNKWAVLIEPTYQYFKSETIYNEQSVNAQIAKVDYKSIEFQIGIRHYFFLNDKSKFFINGSYVLDFSFNSNIELDLGLNLDIEKVSSTAFGLGYNYNNKYSLELRYGLSRDLLTNYANWSTDFNSLSVIFGYTIF